MKAKLFNKDTKLMKVRFYPHNIDEVTLDELASDDDRFSYVELLFFRGLIPYPNASEVTAYNPAIRIHILHYELQSFDVLMDVDFALELEQCLAAATSLARFSMEPYMPDEVINVVAEALLSIESWRPF